MNNVLRAFVSLRLLGRVTAFLVAASAAFGAPPVLRWNGPAAGTNVWDTTTVAWLDSGANAVAWQPGATAQFDGAGGIVNIAADVTVSNITFATTGYALLGAGRFAVEGTLSVAATVTNCIAADLLTVGGLSKTGLGALALARCTGPFAAAEGTLLVSGSSFNDADLSVASGATLVTLGDPDTASNLILNPGFEFPAMASGSYNYVGGGNLISNWTATALAANVGRQNTAIASQWNGAGAAPDGLHMLILQYNGAIAQTVTVPADGLYSVAFSYLMRNNNLEHQVYVTLDGIPLATFLNRSVQYSPGRFASGALFLKAGAHTLGIAGEGGWGDHSTMVDTVCFAAPSASNAGRAFGGDSILRSVTGASVVLNHSGTLTLAKAVTNGVPASGTFNASNVSGIFSGPGSLSCANPGYVFESKGASGSWSSAGLWTDGVAPTAGGGQNLKLFFPSAASSTLLNDLSGTGTVNRLRTTGSAAGDTFALSGNTVAFTNTASGTAPKISANSPGSWIIGNPVTAQAALTLDVTGALTLTNALTFATSTLNLSKFGPGTLTLPSFANCAAPNIYDGTLQTPVFPAGLAVNLFSQNAKTAALTLTRGQTFSGALNLLGAGTSVLATRCGGGTVTLSGWSYGYGDNVLFDVGTNDTLSLRQMLLINNSKGNSVTALNKAGPGTLEIRSQGADSSLNRAYQGPTTLRNGTLTLSEDDCGTLSVFNAFNGRTYSGYGGSLGYSAFSTAVRIGDSGTAASDNLTLIANGNGRWIGHDLEIFNKGASVTLGMTTGTVLFADTITLHRDILLSGPANGIMAVSNVVLAADYAGTGAPLTLSGLAGLRIEGAFPSTASLIIDGRALRFGTYTVKAQTLNALVLGSATTPGTLDVDFAPGVNDTVAASSLTLSNTVVNLYCAGSGLPFAEPGTYTLFTYTGTLGGNTALLSLGNPQSGASYAFSNDTANTRVLLTIGNTSEGTSIVWKNAASGTWSLGSNWDSGSGPSGTGVTPLFGLAITSPATVTLDSDYTVGGLTFNNASYGYTLSGGSLTLNNGASTPTISVLSGTHAIDTTLNGSSGLAVATAANATLVLNSNAVANTGLSLSQGTVELRGNATVNGATALAASTLLRVAATHATIGTLTAQATAATTLSGTTTKLTVNQNADGTFSGVLRGDSGALVKSGTAALLLDAPATVYSGRTDIVAGTLALKATPLAGPVSIGASGTLAIQAAATNGLMGYYYNVTPNTNNFWTLAGMESHFLTLKPDLASSSGLAGTTFDFTTSGTLFPQPYGAGGSRTVNFEAVFRGTITVPESGTYAFGVTADDGFVLAIDGQTVASRNYNVGGSTEGNIRLDAGRYDIVLGYFQMTSSYGLQLRVRPPSATTASTYLVPNAWLTPYSSVGTLSGSGALSLAASNAQLRVTQSFTGSFLGDLPGAAGSFLAKEGNGLFSLDGNGTTPNAFGGDIDVRSGILRLGGNERVGDASTLRVRTGATLAVVDQETIGALAGGGNLLLGGYVYFTTFSGDSDCDIFSSKTYTHLLDFPANGSAATVNGVAFTDAGFSGSANGYAWNTTGTVPPMGWTNGPFAGVTQLLDDFSYFSTNFTLTLSGLATNTAYETRIYFRNFANNPRFMTLTFTSGAKNIGSYSFNPDATGLVRSWVGCRYTTDASGTLSIWFLGTDPLNSPHIYGLSNERVLVNTSADTLTVAPASGRTSRFSGSIAGNSGAVIKTGAGTQAFNGPNTLPNPLVVQQGTATLESGVSITAGVAVATGAIVEAPYGGATLGGLTGQGLFSLGACPTNVGTYFVNYTNDAGTGISTAKTYTHLLDFGSGTTKAVVNGIAFEKTTAASGTLNGYGWNGAPGGYNSGGNSSIGVPSNQGIYNLIYDMNLGMATGTLYLTGLTVGKRYEVRLYHRCWAAGTDRSTRLIFDPDGTGPIADAITFNPDAVAFNDNYLGYRYLAASNALAITIQSLRKDQYHIYGLSNEESYDTLGNPVTLNIAGSSVFDGAITGLGGLVKAGLGAFTVTGNSTATGPVAVNAGAFGVAGGGCATRGPVSVAAGATLFGNGRVGGDVLVASNAWLQAGTASACGSLQIGGSLTLALGTRLAWRFDVAAADTITVAGLLTFPTNGVVQASALSSGVFAPAKTVLFASQQAINGPDTLTGWTVTGVNKATLAYSDDHTKIYLQCPRGTVILLQ